MTRFQRYQNQRILKKCWTPSASLKPTMDSSSKNSPSNMKSFCRNPLDSGEDFTSVVKVDFVVWICTSLPFLASLALILLLAVLEVQPDVPSQTVTLNFHWIVSSMPIHCKYVSIFYMLVWHGWTNFYFVLFDLTVRILTSTRWPIIVFTCFVFWRNCVVSFDMVASFVPRALRSVI